MTLGGPDDRRPAKKQYVNDEVDVGAKLRLPDALIVHLEQVALDIGLQFRVTIPPEKS